jgi:GPI mannosyltransferase 3
MISGRKMSFKKRIMTMKNYIPGISDHKGLIMWSMAISFCLFFLNSVNNVNALAPDEHFQIIEFAAFKQNKVAATDLAWEYAAKERQALQPFIAFCLFQTLDFLGITGHVDQLVILKILNSLFTLFCIYCFAAATLHYFRPAYQPFYILASFFIWFVPAFYIRFTSETFSQCLLLLACSYFLEERNGKNFLFFAGYILGFTFFARFQSAFSMLGLFLGLFIFRGYRLNEYFKIASGSLISLGTCVLIDRWFYNEWVFTPWRYLSYQIFQGVANDFGTLPFYQYLTYLLTFSTAIFGVLFLFCLLVPIILKKSLNTIYLIVFSTLALLSLIGHKEFRFLLGILLFFPFLLILSMQSISERFVWVSRIFRNRYVIAVFLLINTWFTVISILRNEDIIRGHGDSLASAVTRNYSNRSIKLLYPDDHYHPFKIDAYVPKSDNSRGQRTWLWKKFLMPGDYQDQRVVSLEDPRLFERQKGRTNLLYINKERFFASKGHDMLLKRGYRLVDSTLPYFFAEWIRPFPEFSRRIGNGTTYLFELK